MAFFVLFCDCQRVCFRFSIKNPHGHANSEKPRKHRPTEPRTQRLCIRKHKDRDLSQTKVPLSSLSLFKIVAERTLPKNWCSITDQEILLSCLRKVTHVHVTLIIGIMRSGGRRRIGVRSLQGIQRLVTVELKSLAVPRGGSIVRGSFANTVIKKNLRWRPKWQ